MNTAIGRDVAKAFDDAPFPVLPHAISQRVVFAESAGQGLTVREVAPYGDAAREIAKLCACINITGERKAA